jgi:DNA mismatch repair protein MutS2
VVLLDELGAGTDPVEGSALARALLSHLLAGRCTTFVATHYSELKAFAHTMPGVENASMEFSLETLSPTYRLRVGLPGRSNAFTIAGRLGLSPEIIRQAQALVSPEELETESLLTEIQEAHREAMVARDQAVHAQREAAEERRRLAIRLAAIDAERSAILGEARAQARRELKEIRAEVEELRAEMAGRASAVSLGEKWLAQARARLDEAEEAAAPLPPPRPPEEVVLPGEVTVGDTVWIKGLATTGEVAELSGDSAEVLVGSFRVRVAASDLERRGSAPAPETPQTRITVSQDATAPPPALELDLRGQRVEQALPRVDKYLDDAFLAGMPFVRIIHGKGTGALRQAVREQLRGHPLVKSFRSGEQGEGGTGVTVTYLIEG